MRIVAGFVVLWAANLLLHFGGFGYTGLNGIQFVLLWTVVYLLVTGPRKAELETVS